MRVACILINDLPVQLAVQDHPTLLHSPLVIGGSPQEAKPVLGASGEAVAFGIEPGFSLHQAYALCPEAVFLPAHGARYREVMEEVAGILDGFSPVVETDDTGAFIDIAGASDEKALAGSIVGQIQQRTGLMSSIGISSGKLFARVAALTAAEDVLEVPPGGEKAFIAPKPVDLLQVSARTLQRIRRLGLRTIGQLAAFPPDSLVAQFGTEGARCHELASGIDRSPLTPRNRPATLASAMDLEPPATINLQVLHGCQVVLQEPLERVRRQGRACREALVRLGFMSGESREGRFYFKRPAVSVSQIQHRLLAWLDGGVPSPVIRLELDLILTGESGTGIGLWPGATAPRQGTREVVRSLKERFGYQPLKKVREIDPQARLPERRFGLADVQE